MKTKIWNDTFGVLAFLAQIKACANIRSETKMSTFNGGPVSNLTEIKDAHIDLPIVVANLRERLRVNSDLMASAKTVKLPEGLVRLSVARSGFVSFEYDFSQAHPLGKKASEYADLFKKLAIGPVDEDEMS